MTKDQIVFFAFVALACFLLGSGIGTVTMKWTMQAEVRRLEAQNHELAEEGRKLAAAAYVCMDHCRPTACDSH